MRRVESPPAFPGLARIGQVAVSVSDLDRAVAFYRDMLGMSFLFQAPNVAFFDCAGIRLMLGANPEPPPPGTTAATILYFHVEDILAAFQVLQDRGVTMERPPQLVARLSNRDLWIGFVRDPDANLLGIMAELPATAA